MTVKLSSVAFLAALTAAATAQTTAPKTATTTAHRPATTTAHSAATTAVPSCSKLPELSSKIPALPPGSPCPKPLYILVSEPAVKLQYVSPLEGSGLRETLGIETTTISLDYVDTKIGTGELAAPHKWYTIHYTGYLTDGTKFDSSYDHPGADPISIAYGQHQVIPGWDTGFDGMRIGGKRRLFIPYQLAYGNNGKPPIPPKAELIFDLELVSQSDEKPAPKTPPTPNSSTEPAKPAASPTDPAAKPSTTPPPTDPTKPETTPHPPSR